MSTLCISSGFTRFPETEVSVEPKMNGKPVAMRPHEGGTSDHIFDSFQVRTQHLPIAGDPTRTPHESIVYCSPATIDGKNAVRLLGYCRQARRRIILTAMTRERTFVDYIIQSLHDRMTRQPPENLELRKYVYGAHKSGD